MRLADGRGTLGAIAWVKRRCAKCLKGEYVGVRLRLELESSPLVAMAACDTERQRGGFIERVGIHRPLSMTVRPGTGLVMDRAQR